MVIPTSFDKSDIISNLIAVFAFSIRITPPVEDHPSEPDKLMMHLEKRS